MKNATQRIEKVYALNAKAIRTTWIFLMTAILLIMSLVIMLVGKLETYIAMEGISLWSANLGIKSGIVILSILSLAIVMSCLGSIDHIQSYFTACIDGHWKKLFLKEFSEINDGALEETVKEFNTGDGPKYSFPVVAENLVLNLQYESDSHETLQNPFDDNKLIKMYSTPIYRSFLPKTE